MFKGIIAIDNKVPSTSREILNHMNIEMDFSLSSVKILVGKIGRPCLVGVGKQVDSLCVMIET